MVIPNPTFAMGIDPGLSGGALCFICPAMNVFKVVDLKAKTLTESWRILDKACIRFILEYSNLLNPNLMKIQIAVEDACIYNGNAQTGKSQQLKNVGMIFGTVASRFTDGKDEGSFIKLVPATRWKEYMGLTCHRQYGELDSAYKRRKEAMSKDMAVNSLYQAGMGEASDLLQIKRHDFSEAYLLALYALRSDFIENG